MSVSWNAAFTAPISHQTPCNSPRLAHTRAARCPHMQRGSASHSPRHSAIPSLTFPSRTAWTPHRLPITHVVHGYTHVTNIYHHCHYSIYTKQMSVRVQNDLIMPWFHVQFIACNALQFLCNNCRLSNVMESRQLLHKNCSALHAINCFYLSRVIQGRTATVYYWSQYHLFEILDPSLTK